MEWFKCILLEFVLLFTASLPAAESTKQPAVLLQEAVYAEETEGDIEKAIGLYERVIKESEKIERLGAEATYRLGMCHLKKGDKEKAAQYFQTVVKNYQNQNAIASKANQQLQKIKPGPILSEAEYLWGPVMEKKINDDGVGEDFMFDLDTAKSFSISDVKKWSDSDAELQEKVIENFIVESGVDLMGETSKKCLMGIDMIVMPIHNERWDMPPYDVIGQVSMGKSGSPIPLSADGQLPKTFAFKTAQGGMGILQITEMQDGIDPRHFKIRYKMLQKPLAVFSTEMTTDAREVYLPDIETKDAGVVLDLASGELLKVEQGENDEDVAEYFRLLGKGDIAYDFAKNKGALITLRVGKAYKTEVVNGLLNIKPLAVLREERDMCAYQLPNTPCKLYVVTGGNKRFIVDFISGDDKGINIQYGEVNMPIQREGKNGIIPFEETRISNISKIKELVANQKSILVALATAVKNNDLVTAKILAEEISKQFPKYQQFSKGTNAEISITSGIRLFKEFQNALEEGNVERAKSIMESISVMGPQIEDILETEAQKDAISQTPRKVYIPDADTKNTGVVLDLATGDLLLAGADSQLVGTFQALGKGDLAWDRVFINLRGGKVNVFKSDGTLAELPVKQREGDCSVYDITAPCKLVVKTPEGDNYEVNVLNIENNGINIEYKKLAQREIQKATTAQTIRKVYIPDADTETGFVLDFASGNLLTCPKNLQAVGKVQYFTVKGQGDLFYDVLLGCLRGGKVSIINPDGSIQELPVVNRIADATAYEITPPCKLMVTTAEGDNYEVNVLSADDVGGINIEYRKLDQQEIPKAATLEKDIFLSEDTKALDLATGELLTVPHGEREDILSYFRRLGKGDIGWDKGHSGKVYILTLRGGTVQLLENDKIGELIVLQQESDSKTYEIPYMPCRVVITTAEGTKFEALLLYEKGGIRIQYKKLTRPLENLISGPRETAQAFLDALSESNISNAAKFAYPEARWVDELPEVCEELGGLSLKLESVYANETAAIAISKPVKTKKRSICVGVSLKKDFGKWFVNTIADLKAEEIITKAELKRFLEKNPDAKEVLIETDQLSEQQNAEKKRLFDEAAEKAAAERKKLNELKVAEIKRLEAEKNKNQ